MKRYWSLKGQNRGASLIAVLTAIVFVSIIGVVITQLTVANVQMKAMEQAGKTNFYSAEQVMDDLVAGLNNCAAEQMQAAYLDILSQYRSITASEENLQSVFKKMYIRNLVDYFGVGPAAETLVKKSGTGMYEVGKFSIPTITNCFTEDEYKAFLVIPSYDEGIGVDWSGSDYRADFTNGRFVLEDIEVTVPDADNPTYTTTIHTDIVFNAPNLRFDEGNVIRDFMRYSLIANDSIDVRVSAYVDGNVYAGTGGIYAENYGSGTFVGNTIVTRGDIAVNPGTTLNIGDKANGKAVNLWAENLKTLSIGGSALPSHLNVYGSAYIADDLEMNGKASEVNLAGNYYGYNFQRDYDGTSSTRAPEYSSTIVINATDSLLNMTGLDSLTLAGRSYLYRGENTEDVALGESLSVRSNQLAYYVPDQFVDATDPNAPKLVEPDGLERLSAYLGVDVENYISLGKPVVAYHFQEVSGGAGTMYFLNFAGEKQANNFFAEFYNNNKDRVDEFAKSYLDNSALILESMAVTLKGNILYRNSEGGDLHASRQPYQEGQWQNGGAMYTQSALWNSKYTGLQLYLDANSDKVHTTDPRFTDKDNPEKSMFSTIINTTVFNQMFAADGSEKSKEVWNDAPEGSGDTERNAVILVREGDDTGVYTVDSKIKGGIIIADCNVQVSTAGPEGFQGLIISNGQITFVEGAHIQANEALVSQIFSEDLIGDRLFTPVFKGYEVLNDENIGTINVNKYLTFDNWSKTLK